MLGHRIQRNPTVDRHVGNKRGWGVQHVAQTMRSQETQWTSKWDNPSKVIAIATTSHIKHMHEYTTYRHTHPIQAPQGGQPLHGRSIPSQSDLCHSEWQGVRFIEIVEGLLGRWLLLHLDTGLRDVQMNPFGCFRFFLMAVVGRALSGFYTCCFHISVDRSPPPRFRTFRHVRALPAVAG